MKSTAKKKTSEKKETKPAVPQLNIQNCNFTGVEWDKSAIESLNKLSDNIKIGMQAIQAGMEANKNLTELFKKSNVRFDSLLKIDGIDGASICGNVLKGY